MSKKSTKEVILTNTKGQFDKYLVLKASQEELAQVIKDAGVLKTVNKLINNAAFYVTHGKPLDGMSLPQSAEAIRTTKLFLSEVANGLRAEGTIERKSMRFYDYTIEQVMAMDLEALRKIGNCLSSYLTNNGYDARYAEYYEAYSSAKLKLTPVTGAISKADVKAILDRKLNKVDLIDALTELLSK